MKRRWSRPVHLGTLTIGGNAPVTVQSMTKTDTRDVVATVNQVLQLEQAGCEIIRLAVPDHEAAMALGEIKSKVHIPIVADIHFDYRIALTAVAMGVDGLRINPGNIGSELGIRSLVESAKTHGIPIRIGVNSGSVEKDILAKYGHPCAEAMIESALRHVLILEKLGYEEIVLSMKAADVNTTIDAYRLIADQIHYPLHVGVTEAGTKDMGTIKSAVGIGALLYMGIGDTIRVSLTADPIEEVRVGWDILKSLGLRTRGPEIISCPTCGRTRIDLLAIARQVEERIKHFQKPLKVAIMGCVVNGPGEAREADVGIAGGDGQGILFMKGKIVKSIPEDQLVQALIDAVEELEFSED